MFWWGGGVHRGLPLLTDQVRAHTDINRQITAHANGPGSTQTHVMKTIWWLQRVRRRSERGALRFRTWCGLSHLGLTGLRGWVTTGHTGGGPVGTEELTQPLHMYLKTRQTSRGCCNQGGKINTSQTPADLGCGGYTYPFCSARTNRGGGAFHSLICRCILGDEPNHFLCQWMNSSYDLRNSRNSCATCTFVKHGAWVFSQRRNHGKKLNRPLLCQFPSRQTFPEYVFFFMFPVHWWVNSSLKNHDEHMICSLFFLFWFGSSLVQTTNQ